MLLNDLEKILMNSPLRWATQRGLDVRFFQHMGGDRPVGRALEMGCGNGRGVAMILRHFQAQSVDAFDLDPAMVALASRRLAGGNHQTRLWVGDATALPLPDETYDAVFDFGIIHHVEDWRLAIAEAHRVLKSGGRFYVFELLAPFVQHPVWRVLLRHPQQDRFDHTELERHLTRQGFFLLGSRDLLGQMGWYVGQKL